MRENVNARRAMILGLAGLLALGAGSAGAGTAPPMPPNDTVPAPLWLETSATRVVEGESFEVEGHLGFAVPYELTVELKYFGDVGGKDVAPSPATLVFAQGELFASVTLTATEDGESETLETLVLTVDDPRVELQRKQAVEITDSGAVLTTAGSTAPTGLPCIENPKLSIATDTKFVAESGGAATVTLTLAGAGCSDHSYPIRLAGDADPSEIVVSADSFELPMGTTSASITVSALDDANDEPMESIELRLAPTPDSDLEMGVTLNLLDDDADIALANLSGPPRLVAGERVQFELAVINPGHKELTSVHLVETPLEGLIDVEWTCFGKSGAECPEKGVGFVDLSASMPAFSAIVVLVDGQVSPAQRKALMHQVSVTVVDGTLSDPNPGDNSAFATHAVEVVADLALELEVGPWDPKDSDPALTYTLVVRNLGPSDAAGAVVTSPLGGHLAWAGGHANCGADDASVTCDVESLAAGTEQALEMVLSVLAPYPAFTTQEAWLDPSDPDPFEKNNETALETKLDLFVPTLDEVVAIATAARESLGSCSQLAETPVRLELRFSEELVGGGAPGAVDSTASYRLYAPGPDGDFEVSACGVPPSDVSGIDDVEIPLLGARWNPKSATVELDVAGSPFEATDGVRRLIACESLRDFGENPIDGDGDGNPGDAAIRSFRIDTGNLVRNGHFDCNLDGWSALAPAPEDWTLGADASGSALSASSRIDNSAAWPAVGLGVCVPTVGGSRFEFSLRHRLTPVKPGSVNELGTSPIVDAEVDVVCTPYPTVNCTGAVLSGDDVRRAIRGATPTTADWRSVVRIIQLPNDTLGSLLCTVSASGEYTPFVLEVDEVRLHAVDRSASGWRGVGGEQSAVATD